MKIVIVCDALGEENNGTTVAAMNLYRHLIKCGDDVHVLCCDQDKKDLPNFHVVPTINLGHLLNKIVEKNNVSLAKPVKKIICETIKDADIVHILIPLALGSATAKMCKKMNIPYTSAFHCQAENFSSHILFFMNSKFFNDIVYKIYYKNVYANSISIHYPTQFIQDTFERSIKRKTNGYVISNGVDARYVKKDINKFDDGNFHILFTGRFSKEKSHKVLVKAVALSKYKDKIQLHFAGQGPREKQVMDYAKKLGIKTPITKFYSRDDLVNLINKCDLYVHPAEIEIEAVACLEAITCGLVPVISNSPRCATKVFAKDSRCLFKVNDSNDLAKKIDYWIENPEEKEKMIKSYEGFAKNCDLNHSMKHMRVMLLDAIKKHEKRKN